MELIRNFSGLGKGDAVIAGGKGASLGEMSGAGIPVPPGFVVLSSAFERFIEETDLNTEIDSALHEVNREEMHTVERASAAIQEMILAAKMPDDIALEIKAHFAKLGAQYVAVRSSATAEDSASAAWAGQLDSFLNTTEKSLLLNVQRCWASLFTPRAIFYRFEKDLHLTKISVAVVVQKMVESECSGIAFSVHPVTEDRNQLIIEAGFGLGEAIVSGQVTPDSYVVEKEPRRIIDTNVSTQTRALYRKSVDGDPSNPSGQGNEWQEIAEPQASSQVLSPEQILELSELIIKIENHYGFPCDIEWAFEGGKFYIVQSRPITTLSPVSELLTDKPVSNPLTFLKNKEDYDVQGQWVCPVLAWSVWAAWAHAPKAKEFGFKKIGSQYLIINHYSFLEKDSLHQEATRVVYTELIADRDDTANKVFTYLKDLEEQILKLTEEIKEKSDSLSLLKKALLLYAEAVFPEMLVDTIDFAAERFIDEAIAKDTLDSAAVYSQIKDLKTLAHLDFDALRAFKEELLRAGFSAGVAFKNIEVKLPELAERLTAHQKETEFMGTHNCAGSPRTMDKLLAAIFEAPLTFSATPTPVEISPALSKALKMAEHAIYWRTQMGEQLSRMMYAARPALTQMAAQYSMNYEQFMYATYTEVIDAIDDAASFDREKILARVGKKLVIVTPPNDPLVRIVHGSLVTELEQKFDILPKSEDVTVTEITGKIAFKGSVVGRVAVVLKSTDAEKVAEGMMLVAPETTPDFIFAMNKAAAFVTDRGGITSHAAIIAREMRKPCIIATKVGTRVLKDGDLVEVDANTGVVKILERAGDAQRGDFLKKFELDKPENWNEQGRWILSPFMASAMVHHHMLSRYAQELLPCVPIKSYLIVDHYNFQLKKDKANILNYVKNLYGQKGGLEALYKKIDALGSDVVSKLKQELEKDEAYRREHIASILETYRDLNDYWLIGSYIGDLCIELAKDVGYIQSEQELFGKVGPFLRDTWIEREVKDVVVLAELCVQKLSKSVVTAEDIADDAEVKKAVEKYLQDYSWVKISWWMGESVGIAHAVERINQEIKNITEGNHIKTHKKSEAEMDGLVGISVASSFWRAECGMMVAMAGERLGFIFDDIAKANDVTKEEALLLTYPEVMEIVQRDNLKIADFNTILQRKGEYFLMGDNAGGLIVFGKDDLRYAALRKSFITAPTVSEDNILKGLAASPGKAKGTVRVIQSASEFGDFKEGEILVSVETSPMFVPLMRKAAAILTGRGGITSHAAIVSRELKKPCIIAIKDIVKILKTGDVVEVDANTGTVKILNK